MTGVAQPLSIVAAPGPLVIREMPAHASNYSKWRRRPTVIVIHATHGSEGVRSAENAAHEITLPDRKKSWHYAVDADSVVRSVPDELRAWHCGTNGNAVGIGVEICGRADQTLAQWLDASSLPTLRLAARLCTELCLQWSIPPVLLSPEELVAGRPGITRHVDVKLAWAQTTHTDPGPHFPIVEFVGAIAKASVVLGPPPPVAR